MTLEQLIETLTSGGRQIESSIPLELSPKAKFAIYPRSVNRIEKTFLCAARAEIARHLLVISTGGENGILQKFQGEILHQLDSEDTLIVKQCPLNHHNAEAIRELFPFTRPVLIGLADSFGFGCRLGLANPAHLRAVAETRFKPVLAQQSIRELQRTERTPEEVMDAATWAVFQEGYKDGFGADADHLKTEQDIDLMVKAGFTFFTLDPSAFVVNDAAAMRLEELENRAAALAWTDLGDTFHNFVSRYDTKAFTITDDFIIQPSREEILQALVKYGGVIAHTARLYRYLKSKYPDHPSEVELSVDETDAPTSAFEHFLVANELKRLGVKLVSLAPRFVGDFEKGIDFKGDLALFEQEYVKHVKIAEALGPYKISIHSGSDKFSVYNVIGGLKLGHIHVKTAGTSYLEALRTIAAREPELFGEILDFARRRYETDKASYHVSARLDKILSVRTCTPERFLRLFADDDARQVLHVTFGSVLTCKDSAGKPVFKERILRALEQHEEAHYENLQRHFRRHLEPFLP